MNSSIIIREIDSISEMKTLEQLQKDVWGWDDLDTMPLMNFIVTREVGGVLIGAFDEKSRLDSASDLSAPTTAGSSFIHTCSQFFRNSGNTALVTS